MKKLLKLPKFKDEDNENEISVPYQSLIKGYLKRAVFG